MFSRKIIAAAFAVAFSISSACFAATWTGASAFPFPANNNWSNSFNWLGSSIPNSSPATDVIFGQSPRLSPIQDLGDNFVIHNLVFDYPGFQLSGASIAPAFIFSGSNATIANSISMPGNMTFAGEGSATLNGVLSGAGGLIMNSQGQLTLGALNTYTGTTQINSGQVVIGQPDSLAKSTVIINSNNGLNLNNHEFPNIGGLAGSGNLYLGDPFPTFDPAALQVGGNNSSTTYSGTITTGGLRWINKLGTGTLTLTGSNSACYMIYLSEGGVVLSGGSLNGFLQMGGTGNNTSMTIQNGAVVDSRGGDINYVVGNSTLRVSGPGTIWRAGDTRLAFSQGTSGNAIIENGATVTDSSKFIVGQGGPATLLLQSGATITTAQGVIGQNVISGNNVAIGNATVTGNGTAWTNTTSLNLGGLQAGITGGTGILNINSGAAVVSNGPTNLWSAPSTIKVNGGTLTTASLVSSSGMGSIDLIDPIAASALNIYGASGTVTYSGAITGTGGILKTGGSTQILNGNLSYLGPTTVNGGTLQISQSDLGNRSFRANPGGTILYNTPLITGGFLRGAGFHNFSPVQQIQGTTFGTDTLINQTSPLKLLNATISGTFNSIADLTADGVVVSSAGTLNVLGSVTSTSLESNGVLRIAANRSLANTGMLVLGGGSRTTIDGSGQLNVTNGTIELNGALLVNNGEISGTTNVNFGSLAKGAGKYGAVNVTDGGKFSPGNSPGTVTTGSTTWNSGGGYLVEISDALNGSGRDFWQVDGVLNLNASSAHPFTISLASIDGLAFDNTRDYTWQILHADAGITGIDPSALALDISGFKNSLGAGQFTVQNTPTDLSIHFSSVPEPAIAGASLFFALATFRRRRNS
jgi:fibronectin-binding autotransporter adhesin